MSVGLYMDVHVPGAITRGLLLRGIDVLTAQIDGTTRLGDPELLDRARILEVCFSTRTMICSPRRHVGNDPAVPSRASFTRINSALLIGRAINDLEILAKAGMPEDFADRVEYLPL